MKKSKNWFVPEDQRTLPNITLQEAPTLASAQKRGTYKNLRKLLTADRLEIIEALKQSGQRGRGGAGFPTGLKWSFMPPPETSGKPHYVICNADEGEPGTCKDREILKWEPHALIEGMVIACATLGAEVGYIYIRGEYAAEAAILQKALDDAQDAGFLGKNILGSGKNVILHIHLGAGAYICGEETALIESLEGKKGQPRLKPPFPAQHGLYGCPTTVNNVETLAQIPFVLKNLQTWLSYGAEGNKGTKLFCLSGCLNTPCVVEAPMGINLKVLLEAYGGGVRGGWENLQAIIPGGSSCPILPAKGAEDVTMDFDSLRTLGSGLGTAGVVVMDKTVDVLAVMTRISAFYHHESCGQCTPCREGVGWVHRLMARLAEGNGTKAELTQLEKLTKQIEGHTICAFADGAMWPVQGTLKYFKKEFQKRLA